MAVRELQGPNAKAVVEKVIAALEQGGSRGFDRTTRAPVVVLKPDLDGLIKVSEKMSAAMRGQVEVCKLERAKTLRSVGDCNVKKDKLEEELASTKASYARDEAKMMENFLKILKVRQEVGPRGQWGGTLDTAANDVLARWKNVQDGLKSAVAGAQNEIDNLNASIAALDIRSQVYVRKMEEFDQAVLYYRQLSDAIENLQTNLAQRMVALLLEKKELVRLTANGDGAGQRVTSTLKEILILLAGEYDLYVRNGLPQISGIPPLLSRM